MKRGYLLKKSEVAELLGVHRNTVTNLLERGDLGGASVPDLVKYCVKQEAERCRSRLLQTLKEVTL